MPNFEIYTRKIKTITGNGSTKVKITPTPGKRLFSVQATLSYTGGTNTIAGMMTNLTEIRVKVGTRVRWRITGTKLRDWMLLRGPTYDFNGQPNIATTFTGVHFTIALAPEWFLPNVQDMLAWNPALLGGDITIELDSTLALTVTNAYERVNNNLSAPSAGIITLETINPVAGGTSFYVEKEIDSTGKLISASVYLDSGSVVAGLNEISPVSLFLGREDEFAHEDLTSAENDEQLERFSLTPAASGRSAAVYDVVAVRDDGLARAFDLDASGVAKMKIGSIVTSTPGTAAAMSGTVDIVLCRLEQK